MRRREEQQAGQAFIKVEGLCNVHFREGSRVGPGRAGRGKGNAEYGWTRPEDETVAGGVCRHGVHGNRCPRPNLVVWSQP